MLLTQLWSRIRVRVMEMRSYVSSTFSDPPKNIPDDVWNNMTPTEQAFHDIERMGIR